jgi:hypothetical protein
MVFDIALDHESLIWRKFSLVLAAGSHYEHRREE